MIKWLMFFCDDVCGVSLSQHDCFSILEDRGRGADNHVGLFGIGLRNKQMATTVTIKTPSHSVFTSDKSPARYVRRHILSLNGCLTVGFLW